ncbi:MAG TPA: multidrug efflux RND transporter permease subunit [Bryobacteraceae bacterium]|nr:multidrug efflux RND transporter permease subunit [Bryobacteraceae bacterium]
MSRFFINRPIVAIVIAILTVILGSISLATLPVAQYPDIVPPEVTIQATYLGADAQTIEQSVAAPIEQQMSGVDNMNYMFSTNANNGSMGMRVNFDLKTQPNIDLILTQMRQSLAATQLPADVNNFGVIIRKAMSSPLLMFALYSPRGTRDRNFLANYGYINLVDELARVPGVGDVMVYGGRYAMRIWVKPDQLSKLHITVPEIVRALQQQNTVNPAGQVGGEPAPAGQEFTYTMRAQGRLLTPEEFGRVVLRADRNGSVLRLQDVARVELGAEGYNVVGRVNGQPAAIIPVFQLPGSNALDAANRVRERMEQLKQRFPDDVDYKIAIDTTLPVTAGIREIIITLIEALLLVALVVYVFLQDWRATLIPLLAVPVSLVGTFMLFPVLGFSINTLSLFGLVLAIGLVVDDAIVVVEVVQRHIEEGIPPKEAAFRAMQEVQAPVIGIAIILAAVFVPTVFVPGITGRLYQQFAMTIAISVIISAFNALTFSPAMAAILLRPRKPARGPLGVFFRGFNRSFESGRNRYVAACASLIRKWAVALLVLAACAATAGWFGTRLPTGFLPEEDQGYVLLSLQLPDAASLQRTDAAVRKVEQVVRQVAGVEVYASVIGINFLSGVQDTYSAFFFIKLKPWEERKSKEETAAGIVQVLNRRLSTLPDGIAFSITPPAIPGVGSSGGFTFVLEDRAGRDLSFLQSNLGRFVQAARQRPELSNLTSTFLPTIPQVFADVDRDKTIAQGASVGDVYQTLQAFMGGAFVNYFNRFGRQWRVFVEAEGEQRARPENVNQFYVRNASGGMVPLSALTTLKRISGPEFTQRYNMYRCAQIFGTAAPGYSSGQAMDALEDVFRQTMPREMGFDYSGMSFQEQVARKGLPAWVVFAMSLVFAFLILAALYESWTLPMSVLLGTPVAVAGAMATLAVRHMTNDVYAQIGLVMLIGLAAKNAILIVEFAKVRFLGGMSLSDSALEAAKLRLRPILMTSFAFILGCVPLWLASGASAVARRAVGSCVIGGMAAATCIAVLLIPVTFCLMEKVGRKESHARQKVPLPAATD